MVAMQPSAREEVANGLHAMQPRDDDAGRSLLEVAQRQAQHMTEHLTAEHGVDAVPGVNHQVLAQPGHHGREHHEHHERESDHRQRAVRLMHDHLVDDRLCEQRRRERHELNRQRGEQDIAEDALVLDQLGDEPAEAEVPASCGIRGAAIVRTAALLLGPLQCEQHRLKLTLELGDGHGLAGLRSCSEQQDALAVRLQDQRGPELRVAAERYGGQAVSAHAAARQPLLTQMKAERLRRFPQTAEAVGRRVVLQNQSSIERHPEQLTQAAQHPQELITLERRVEVDRRRLGFALTQAKHDGFSRNWDAAYLSNGRATLDTG